MSTSTGEMTGVDAFAMLDALPERVIYSDFCYTCDDFRLRSRWPPPTAHAKQTGMEAD